MKLWQPKRIAANSQARKPLTAFALTLPAVPKGTRLIVTAHFDNSVKNMHNPDPAKVVRWGDPTYDEMMIGWIEYTVPIDGKPN